MTTDRPRLFTFRSGGWVLLLAALMCALLAVWAIAPALMRSFHRPPGDGKNIESYAFDLTNLSVPRELVAPAMLYRDMVPVMHAPTASGPDPSIAPSTDPESHKRRWEAMQKRNDPKYGKYVVANDLVIGVQIDGEARAYPIHVMNVHEIVNDTLGGTPIAVTYNWLCDSVVVFDRAFNGSTIRLGHSGLVYNSNMLIYDFQPASEGSTGDDYSSTERVENASLWPQLLGKAISGPSVGQSLRTIPASLVSWGEWSSLHPDTTVLNRDLGMTQRYKEAAPKGYFASDELLFRVQPTPDPNGPSAKTRVMAVRLGEDHRVYALPDVLAAAIDGVWTDTFGSTALRFICNRQTQTVRVEDAQTGEPVQAIHCFWFAWHAIYPQDELHHADQ